MQPTPVSPSLFRDRAAPSVVLVASLVVTGLSLGGCVFMDDDTRSSTRGYTDCGSFLGGEQCSPGQYCADPGFSMCENGCLSDVNCASNQVCAKAASQQVGVCQNEPTRRSSALSVAPDAGSDVGVDVSGGDAGGR